MARNKNWIKIAIGLVLMIFSITNLVPGDEFALVPIGVFIILDALGIKIGGVRR